MSEGLEDIIADMEAAMYKLEQKIKKWERELDDTINADDHIEEGEELWFCGE